MADWQNSNSCPAENTICPSDDVLRNFLSGRIDEAVAAKVEPVFMNCTECARRCKHLAVRDNVVSALAKDWKPASSSDEIARMMSSLINRASPGNHQSDDPTETYSVDVESENETVLWNDLQAGADDREDAKAFKQRQFGDYELLDEIAH